MPFKMSIIYTGSNCAWNLEDIVYCFYSALCYELDTLKLPLIIQEKVNELWNCYNTNCSHDHCKGRRTFRLRSIDRYGQTFYLKGYINSPLHESLLSKGRPPDYYCCFTATKISSNTLKSNLLYHLSNIIKLEGVSTLPIPQTLKEELSACYTKLRVRRWCQRPSLRAFATL